MSEDVFALRHCRLCKNKNLEQVLNFGKTALANSFLKKSQLNDEEPIFPLALKYCPNCGQLQTSHVVSPDLMFRDYVWVSSTSSVTVKHFEEYAESVYKKLNLKKGDLVVEMGSNDGALLKPFKKLGAKVLGVDPARNIARRTAKNGIPTLPHYFDSKIAEKMLKSHGKAKVIIGNNVFAHIHDLGEIIKAVDILLDSNGVFIVEFPYLVDFLDKNLFDISYHEHLSYPAIRPFKKFFKSVGMQLFDVTKTPVHGGSIRLFVQRKGGKYKIDKSVEKHSALERRKKMHKAQTFHNFGDKVRANKKELNKILKKLVNLNKKIVGYGAPAKATTLLSFFGIDNKILAYIIDDSPYKQGLFTPGSHIPVVAVTEIKKVMPDYILILAWNFADPIMAKPGLEEFRGKGGQFIIPVPEPKIV